MLYLTTRDKHDAKTCSWTMKQDTAEDGGLYVPFQLPALPVAELKEKSFGQTVADVLNLFFSAGLTGWDVELCIGRYPVRIAPLGQKVLVAECWRNLDGSFAGMEQSLAQRICSGTCVTSWMRIAVRMAVLAAVFGELLRQEMEETVDVSVSIDDFSMVMAAWYGRKMGLPIGNIICGCRENDAVWELLHMGQLRTSGGVIPELERLIYGTFGVEETLRYSQICENNDIYTLLPNMSAQLREGMFAAVISGERVKTAIPSVYRTGAYVMGPDVAVAYSSLMDYRAKSGERPTALLIGQADPLDAAQEVAAAMKLSREELKELLR